MKSTRHNLILEIIENKDIETQEELAAELKSHGVEADVSGFIRGISKISATK